MMMSLVWREGEFVNYREYKILFKCDFNYLLQLSTVGADLESMYSKGKACNKPGDGSNKCYPLDPGSYIIINSHELPTYACQL